MPYKDGYTTAMVVVAHPDDAEFGFSGTIAKWCMEGMDVFYVLCEDVCSVLAASDGKNAIGKSLKDQTAREEVLCANSGTRKTASSYSMQFGRMTEKPRRRTILSSDSSSVSQR